MAYNIAGDTDQGNGVSCRYSTILEFLSGGEEGHVCIYLELTH